MVIVQTTFRSKPLRPDRITRRIYCDESSYNHQKYFALGAIWHEYDHNDFEVTLLSTKRRFCLYDEIKWRKVPTQPGKYFDGYKALIDRYFELPVRFKVIVVDTDQYPLSHPTYSAGDAELGYYKFYYQLIYAGLMIRNPTRNYLVQLDHRPSSEKNRLLDLERCLNAAALRDGFPDMLLNGNVYDCCLVEENDSKKVQGIQLADLLTGMVAAKWNGNITNPTKLILIDYLESQLGKTINAPSASPISESKFNIWFFRSKRS